LIVVFLYRFSTAAGASAYGSRIVAADQADTTMTVTPFTFSAVPGALGFSLTDGTSHAAKVIFTNNNYLVQLEVVGPTSPDLQPLAQQIATDQNSRL
jgi:hypothetical protein